MLLMKLIISNKHLLNQFSKYFTWIISSFSHRNSWGRSCFYSHLSPFNMWGSWGSEKVSELHRGAEPATLGFTCSCSTPVPLPSELLVTALSIAPMSRSSWLKRKYKHLLRGIWGNKESSVRDLGLWIGFLGVPLCQFYPCYAPYLNFWWPELRVNITRYTCSWTIPLSL